MTSEEDYKAKVTMNNSTMQRREQHTSSVLGFFIFRVIAGFFQIPYLNRLLVMREASMTNR